MSIKKVFIAKLLQKKIKELAGSDELESKRLIGDVGRSLTTIYAIHGIDPGIVKKHDKNLLKSSINGKLKTLAKNKEFEKLKNSLELIKYYQKETNSIVFTPKHGVWKLEPKEECKPVAKEVETTKRAVLKFKNLQDAEKFAKEWTRETKKGHTIGAGKENVPVFIYDVTAKEKEFIDNYVKSFNEKAKKTKPEVKNPTKPAKPKKAKPEVKNTPKPASELSPPEAKKPAKRAPRIAVRALLNSSDPKEVFLGFIYKLSHAVAATKKTKQGKALISRYMNAIKKGYMLEDIEVINKELGDDIEKFAPNVLAVRYEATQEEQEIFQKIFERYRSFMNEKRAPKKAKYDKEKENALSILAKMRGKK